MDGEFSSDKDTAKIKDEQFELFVKKLDQYLVNLQISDFFKSIKKHITNLRYQKQGARGHKSPLLLS